MTTTSWSSGEQKSLIIVIVRADIISMLLFLILELHNVYYYSSLFAGFSPKGVREVLFSFMWLISP